MPENENIETAPQFDAGAAAESLLAEQEQQEQQEQQTEELSPEEARKAEVSAGLNSLLEDEWTQEEILAFSQDALVREDIQKNGKTVRQAARAYLRRQAAAPQEEHKGGKRGVPVVRNASNSGSAGRDQIAEMSDKEFEAFYKQAMSDSLAGKKRRL